MTLSERVENAVRQAGTGISETDKVGISLYLALEESGSRLIEAQSLRSIVRDSEISVEGKSVYGLVGNLDDRGFVRRDGGRYGLKLDGREYFESLVGTTEQAEPREGNFLSVTDPGDDFYSPLITDINACYKSRVYDAVLVLTRKLFENLLIELLRGHFGMEEISLFYIEEQGRFQPFSNLLENAKERSDDLRMYNPDIASLLDEMERFREKGNASAHSIDVNVSEEEIDSLSEAASELARQFLRLKKQVEVAPSN
jgi:hypothetical protein